MSKINAICVYCGSNPGTDPAFVKAAHGFGKVLAENGIRLVYGGGSIGLMGAVAGAVMEYGGAATGIIPEFLTAQERPLRRGQELLVTTDMLIENIHFLNNKISPHDLGYKALAVNLSDIAVGSLEIRPILAAERLQTLKIQGINV